MIRSYDCDQCDRLISEEKCLKVARVDFPRT